VSSEYWASVCHLRRTGWAADSKFVSMLTFSAQPLGGAQFVSMPTFSAQPLGGAQFVSKLTNPVDTMAPHPHPQPSPAPPP
jgi:hypothetical protein